MTNKLILILAVIPLFTFSQENASIDEYLKVLKNKGEEPVSFVNGMLDDHDLLIFDDALHLAKEPFDFYQELIRNEEFRKKVKYLFVEVFSIDAQPHVNDYLNNKVKDSTILNPVFQNDFSGYGLRYQTYLDLLSTVREVNTQLPASEKIQVICVDQPIYWQGILSRNDYDLFQRSLVGRDYFMYKIILGTLDEFKSGAKGIFLTNTRHSYKGIRKSNGEYYWNTGTFFHQRHPGKTYSIRFHNVNLSIESKLDSASGRSTEGLDRVSYSWVRMDRGLWDKAFAENGNIPVALSLENNTFGNTTYIGNHMLDTAADQTMYDAYDALIFLAPLEDLHFSAEFDFIYSSAFLKELKRRILILEEGRLPDFLLKHKVDSLDEFLEGFAKFEPAGKNTLVPNEEN